MAYELDEKDRKDLACIWYDYFCTLSRTISRHSINATWDCFRYAQCLWNLGEAKAACEWLGIASGLYDDQRADLDEDEEAESRAAEFANLKRRLDELAATVAC